MQIKTRRCKFMPTRIAENKTQIKFQQAIVQLKLLYDGKLRSHWKAIWHFVVKHTPILNPEILLIGIHSE